MKGFAPRTLLAAQGMLAKNDSHARDGYHLRLHLSPWLGLPIVPLVVYRLSDNGTKLRSDVVWLDDQQRELAMPFEVTPGHPVHGYLPPPHAGVCGWLSVQGTVDFGGGLPGVARAAPRAAARTAARSPRAAADSAPVTVNYPGLKLEAQVYTPRGWATVAARSASPWVVSATPIERVTISGSGRVDSASWIDVRQLPDNIDQRLALLELPVQQGRRYQAAAADAYANALAQAERASPNRRALQEWPWAADPFTAPAWTPAQEVERIDALAGDLVRDVRALVNDRLRQSDVLATHAIIQGHTTLPGDGLTRHRLADVLSAAQEAGIARFLGLMSWDDNPPFPLGGSSSTLIYHVLGYWEVEARDGEYGVVQALDAAEQAALGRADIFWPLPADAHIFNNRTRLLTDLKKRGLGAPPGPLGPVALLHTTVVVTARDPMPDAPGAPVITSIGPTEPAWLPGVAPEARRRVAIKLAGLVPGAGLAWARRSDALPAWLPLNPVAKSWRTIIVAGAPATADAPGLAALGDRDAPPVATDYRLAQTDAFGRWSAWAAGEVAAGIRPKPPQPVIEATFTPAQPPDPPGTGLLAGSIRVSVAVPPPANLPPGAHLLDHVRILFDSVEVVSAPPGTQAAVVRIQPGPLLAPTAQRLVRVSAIWVDTAGQSSPESLAVTLNCYDLRSPPQVLLPFGLLYASRADATGHCRAEIAWTVQPGQTRFRVYTAHETTLLSHIEALRNARNADARDLLRTLAGLAVPERAATWRAVSPATLPLPRSLFELLTETPIEAAVGTARFEHALSASLAGLSFYRVVALAQTNVEAPFEEAALLPVAVPNSPTPARPTLELAAIDVPLADARVVPGIRVRLMVPPGLRPALDYRLFRSTEETRDVGRMPQVAAGVLAAGVAGQAQVHTLLLVGDPVPGTPDRAIVGDYDEVLPADIRFWMRYHFRADVRAAPEPGSGFDGTRTVPGDWSSPALPVAVLVLAPEPPLAATGLGFVAARKLLQWQHPDPLLGRHAGSYRFDIYRTAPQERETLLASVAGDAPTDSGGRNPDGSGYFHVGDPNPQPRTRYRLVLNDPLGRSSPVVELTLPRAP